MPGKNLEKNIKNTAKKHKCLKCGTDISDKHPNTKYCDLCHLLYFSTFDEKANNLSGFLDNKKEGEDYVVCSICGWKSQNLQSHLLQVHNIKPKEYREKYHAESICENTKKKLSNKWKGENNPGYHHNGILSPWSYNNKSKSKEEIDACKKYTQEQIKNSNNLNTKLEYWLKETNGNEELAKKLLKNRQSTFSLDKCIEKYGEFEGVKIFQKRQKKWQNTLNNKTEEEISEINKKKVYKFGNISKEEKELYNALVKYIPALEKQIYLRKDKTHGYLYDIALVCNSRIIEFNGDYWHANKNKYNGDEFIKYPNGKICLVEDIWKHDAEKIKCANDNGYKVLVIWESEYLNNKEDTIEKCKNFLLN